jgi:hypothetical protein
MVARVFLAQYTKTGENIPNNIPQHYQMAIKYITCSQDIPNGRIHNIPTFSIPKPSKFYPNWDFCFENIPSGNPEFATDRFKAEKNLLNCQLVPMYRRNNKLKREKL